MPSVKPRFTTQKERTAMVQARRAGRQIKWIAHEYGRSQDTVSKVLRAAGFRPFWHAPRPNSSSNSSRSRNRENLVAYVGGAMGEVG